MPDRIRSSYKAAWPLSQRAAQTSRSTHRRPPGPAEPADTDENIGISAEQLVRTTSLSRHPERDRDAAATADLETTTVLARDDERDERGCLEAVGDGTLS